MYPFASYGVQSEQRNPLIAGHFPIETAKHTLASGTLAAGAIVGKVLGTATAAAAAGNTGNGTIGAVTVGAGAKAGVYTLVCMEPGANAGTFALEDPDGVVVGRAVVGSAFSGALAFTIADGATDFVAGDRFTITVAQGDGEIKLCAAAATDGSQIPHGIAAHAADATDAEAEVVIYTRGEFDETQCSIGAGLTVAGAKETLRARGVFLVPVAKAS